MYGGGGAPRRHREEDRGAAAARRPAADGLLGAQFSNPTARADAGRQEAWGSLLGRGSGAAAAAPSLSTLAVQGYTAASPSSASRGSYPTPNCSPRPAFLSTAVIPEASDAASDSTSEGFPIARFDMAPDADDTSEPDETSSEGLDFGAAMEMCEPENVAAAPAVTTYIGPVRGPDAPAPSFGRPAAAAPPRTRVPAAVPPAAGGSTGNTGAPLARMDLLGGARPTNTFEILGKSPSPQKQKQKQEQKQEQERPSLLGADAPTAAAPPVGSLLGSASLTKPSGLLGGGGAVLRRGSNEGAAPARKVVIGGAAPRKEDPAAARKVQETLRATAAAKERQLAERERKLEEEAAALQRLDAQKQAEAARLQEQEAAHEARRRELATKESQLAAEAAELERQRAAQQATRVKQTEQARQAQAAKERQLAADQAVLTRQLEDQLSGEEALRRRHAAAEKQQQELEAREREVAAQQAALLRQREAEKAAGDAEAERLRVALEERDRQRREAEAAAARAQQQLDEQTRKLEEMQRALERRGQPRTPQPLVSSPSWGSDSPGGGSCHARSQEEVEDDDLIRSVTQDDGEGFAEAVAREAASPGTPLDAALACVERDETKCRIEYEEAAWKERHEIAHIYGTARTNAHLRHAVPEAHTPRDPKAQAQAEAAFRSALEKRRFNAANHPMVRKFERERDMMAKWHRAHGASDASNAADDDAAAARPASRLTRQLQAVASKIEGGETVPARAVATLRRHVREGMQEELAAAEAALARAPALSATARNRKVQALIDAKMPRSKVVLPKLPVVYQIKKLGGTTGSSWQVKWWEISKGVMCFAEDQSLSGNRKVIPLAEIKDVRTAGEAECGRPWCVRIEVAAQKDKLLQLASAHQQQGIVALLRQLKAINHRAADTFDRENSDATSGGYWRDLPGDFMFKPPTQHESSGLFKGLANSVRSDKWTPRWVWTAKGTMHYARKKGDKPEKSFLITDIMSIYAVAVDEADERGVPRHLRDKAFVFEIDSRKIMLATETRAARDKWVSFMEDTLLNTTPTGVEVSQSPSTSPKKKYDEAKMLAAYDAWEDEEPVVSFDLEMTEAPFVEDGQDTELWPPPRPQRKRAKHRGPAAEELFEHTFPVGVNGDLGIVVDPRDGLKIASVKEDASGRTKQLRLGTKIVKVDGVPAHTAEDYEAALRRRREGGKRRAVYTAILQMPPVHVEFFDSSAPQTVLGMPVVLGARSPDPMPQYVGFTPGEMRQKQLAEAARLREARMEKTRHKAQRLKAETQDASPKDTVKSGAHAAALQAATKMQNAMGKARDKAKSAFAKTLNSGAMTRFQRQFPELLQEEFLCNYKCVMQFAKNAGDPATTRHLDTHVMVTSLHIAYYDGGKSKETFRGWIPLESVVSVQFAAAEGMERTFSNLSDADVPVLARSCSSASDMSSPAVSPSSLSTRGKPRAAPLACRTLDWVSEDTSGADVLQVFTKDHHRYDFVKVRPISLEKTVTPKSISALNGLLSYIDAAWREVSADAVRQYDYVPLEGVPPGSPDLSSSSDESASS
eukprot:TRINITY_DN3369_c0_g1_i1.p1 TRINITY_DN3369_c0_g1~~TRINITY_DN3369_c0_g1_i1.p1  ORF type:complete len:1575 (+),score=554.08 TRINITY_DN3369_c0_g1_i1:97-4725(+)